MATQKASSATPTRIHGPDGVGGWEEGPLVPAVQGPLQAGRLIPGLTGERRIRQTFSRDQRLRRKGDFQALREHGVSRAHPLLVLRAVPNALPYARFAFVVGRRVAPNAVDRNRVRRRLREIVRRLPVRGGWDQLLIARKPIVEADFETIRGVVVELERRLGLLADGGNA